MGRHKIYHTPEEKKEALKKYRAKYNKSEKGKARNKRYIEKILNDPIKGPTFKAKARERNKNRPPKTEEQKRRRRLYDIEYRKNNSNYQDWMKNYRKEYYAKNKERIIKQQKEYYANNPDKHEERKIKGRKYYEDNKEKYAEHRQKPEVKKRSQEMARKYQSNKRKTNYNFKMRQLLSSRINHALKGQLKADTTMKLVGCTIEVLKKHLESKFKPGMTWENHTITGWHIDHIKPCSLFDFKDPEQQKECFHYTNLQPLWYDENIRKSNKCELNETD